MTPACLPAVAPRIPRFGDGRDWFFAHRFGLFIHWGIYAIPAWHEQVWQRRHMDRADYLPFADRFNPTAFDPDQWLDLMQDAGMQYLCFTTKHHDGFCMWPTRQTDFNIGNTPCGRDLLGELAAACHRRHVPLCLYYSVVDWHHPNYPNQGRHHELPPQPGATPDMARYVDFVRAQIRELCTDYGPVHGIWWDMNVPEHRDPTVNALIRELQPQAVINDRGFDDGDFTTPERHVPASRAFARPTEACQSLGMQSWGYKADDDYFTTRHVMRSMARVLAMGGNYLLNAGPDAAGRLAPPFVAAARDLGDWLRRVGEAYTDTVPASHLTDNEDVLLTAGDNALYVTCATDPPGSAFSLAPLAAPPRAAVLLNTGQQLDVEVGSSVYELGAGIRGVRIRDLPANALAAEVPVIKLVYDAD